MLLLEETGHPESDVHVSIALADAWFLIELYMLFFISLTFLCNEISKRHNLKKGSCSFALMFRELSLTSYLIANSKYKSSANKLIISYS